MTETNPILQRRQSALLLNKPSEGQTNSKVNQEVPKMIYKPPVRSVSSTPNKNQSCNTTTVSSSNTVSKALKTSEDSYINKTLEYDSEFKLDISTISNTNKSNCQDKPEYEGERKTNVYPNLNIENLKDNASVLKNFLKRNVGTKSTTPSTTNLFNQNSNYNPVTNKTLSSNAVTYSNTRMSSINNAYPNYDYGRANTFSDKTLDSRNKFAYNVPTKVQTNTLVSQHSRANLNSNTYRENSLKKNEQNDYLINLEDLMLLEEKLSDIIFNITSNRAYTNECFEWWNFYFNCSLCGSFEHYFREESSKQTMRDFQVLELLSIIICYNTDFDQNLLDSLYHVLKSILTLQHQNFLILCDYIISKISNESMNNIWVYKLKNLVNTKLRTKVRKGEHSNEIKQNNNCIYDYFRIVLKNYPENEFSDILVVYFKNIARVNISNLNEFFRTKVLRVLNKNASVIASALIDSGETFGTVPAPYIKLNSKKEFTLVLDLDETLIHFKLDNGDDNKGLLRLRPGLFEFLDAVSKHFELIIFTAATQDVS